MMRNATRFGTGPGAVLNTQLAGGLAVDRIGGDASSCGDHGQVSTSWKLAV